MILALIFIGVLWLALGEAIYIIVNLALTSKDRKVQLMTGDLTNTDLEMIPEWFFVLFGPLIIIWAFVSSALSGRK